MQRNRKVLLLQKNKEDGEAMAWGFVKSAWLVWRKEEHVSYGMRTGGRAMQEPDDIGLWSHLNKSWLYPRDERKPLKFPQVSVCAQHILICAQ